MSDTVLERDSSAEADLGVIDCDIHPAVSSPGELSEYLPLRWREHARDYGMRGPNPFVGSLPYPRMGHGMRQDSYPPEGGPPGSSLSYMKEQILDPLNIKTGLLHALTTGFSTFNQDLAAAFCTAVNDWQIDRWSSKDKRLLSGITVPQEDAPAAVKEIEDRAGDSRFAQVTMSPRGLEPAGRRRYWPIYEAVADLGKPLAMHTAAYGTNANTGSGWASFYLEEHYAVAHPAQTSLVSMIFEGVFERFPNLKLVLVEGGFAWLAPLMWRMDREWERMRDEVPHVKRKPSDYVRSNVWLTTQPVEEPPKVKQMTDLLRWIGADRMMFSTDYPHWDFDHPERAFKVGLSPEDKSAILRDNAAALYNL